MIDLGRNLKSGLRLAFGLPISLLQFRVSVRQLLLLLFIGVLIGAANDYLRAGEHPILSMHAIVYEGFEAAALLLTSAILSAAFRQPHLKLAVPVLALASDPALGLLNVILALPGNQSDLLGYSLQWAGFWLLMAWIAFIFWRAIAVSLMPRQPRFWLRSLTGAALLLAGVPLAIWAHQPWFYSAPPAGFQQTRYPSPASEAVPVRGNHRARGRAAANDRPLFRRLRAVLG